MKMDLIKELQEFSGRFLDFVLDLLLPSNKVLKLIIFGVLLISLGFTFVGLILTKISELIGIITTILFNALIYISLFILVASTIISAFCATLKRK